MGIAKNKIFVYLSLNTSKIGFMADYLAELATIMREWHINYVNHYYHLNRVHTMQTNINQNEISMLRVELELLMRERQSLLKVTGAAAGLIAEMDSHDLPVSTIEAADLLATTINGLNEETLQDALSAVHAEIIE